MAAAAAAVAAAEAKRRMIEQRRIEREERLSPQLHQERTQQTMANRWFDEPTTEPAKKPWWAPIAITAADAWFWYDRHINPTARAVTAEVLISANKEVEEFNAAMDVLRNGDTSISRRWDAIGEIADTGINTVTLGAWGDMRRGVQEGDPLRVASGALGIIPVGRLAKPAANMAARFGWHFLGSADEVARLSRTVAFAIGHADDSADLTLAGRELVLGMKNEDLGQVASGVLYGLRPGIRLTRDMLAYRADLAHMSGLGRVEMIGLGGPDYNWHNVPLDSLTIKTTDGIIVLPPDQWAIQGAGILPDDIPLIPRSSTPEGIIYQIPADWQIGAQAHGLGVRFSSPDGMLEVRIHGPTRNLHLDPDASSIRGWVARVQHYDPNDLMAGDFGRNLGWVAHNDLGQSVPMRSDAAHIPVLENPAAGWYNPRPTMSEMLQYLDDLSRRLRGGS